MELKRKRGRPPHISAKTLEARLAYINRKLLDFEERLKAVESLSSNEALILIREDLKRTISELKVEAKRIQDLLRKRAVKASRKNLREAVAG